VRRANQPIKSLNWTHNWFVFLPRQFWSTFLVIGYIKIKFLADLKKQNVGLARFEPIKNNIPAYINDIISSINPLVSFFKKLALYRGAISPNLPISLSFRGGLTTVVTLKYKLFTLDFRKPFSLHNWYPNIYLNRVDFRENL
jgi:hypothetical protein